MIDAPDFADKLRRWGLIYLSGLSLMGFALIGALAWFSRDPRPAAPAPAPPPAPEALSTEDRAAYEEAVEMKDALLAAAIVTRVWRWRGPEPGGWPEGAEEEPEWLKAATLAALEPCNLRGRLRVLDCSARPCVAWLAGEGGACEAWPEEVEQRWGP